MFFIYQTFQKQLQCFKFFVLVFFLTTNSCRLTSSFFLPSLSYPIVFEHLPCPLPSNQLLPVPFGNQSWVMYRHENGPWEIYSDQCPHMGSTFSKKGWKDEKGCLRCPYHGMTFSKGQLQHFPSMMTKSENPKLWLPPIHYFLYGGMLWYTPIPSSLNSSSLLLPYLPPEEHDEQFRKIEGFIDINQYQPLVTENVLDMLHISYVHSFGNRLSPFPIDIEYEKLSNHSGQTRFLYSPPHQTISQRVGKVNTVLVENEFHLPTTTITRVIANQVTKTVWTASLPLKGKKTRLFWRIYRNFWRDPCFPCFDIIGDLLLRYLMIQTLKEDQDILSQVHHLPSTTPTIRTKFDVTILKYQNAIQQWIRSVPPKDGKKENENE